MSTTLNKSNAIKWAVTAVLAIIPLLIPEAGVYTFQVKLFAAITICGLAMSALEIVPILFVGLMMPAAWIITGVAPAKVVMSPWLGSTFLMIPGAYFMAASLEDSGLLKRIAFWMMCKMKGSYLAIMMSIFVVTVILNILTSGRGYLIMAALAMGLCMSLGGMQKKLGAGLAMAVLVGGCTSHSFTYQASMWGVIYSAAGEFAASITPLTIMRDCWPLFFVAAFITFVMCKMFKPDVDLSNVSYFSDELAAMGKLTKREIVNAVMLLLVLIYIFTVDIHHLDVNLAFVIIPLLVYLPGLDGATEETMKKVNFPIIMFCAACMGIGTVATSLGLGDTFISLFESLLNGKTDTISIMLVIFALVFLLNFLMTPIAIFALIMTPVLTFVVSLGFAPEAFVYAINACTEAIIFPYEFVPYLIVFSFGMISMRDFIKANIVRSVIFFAGFLVVLVPYWTLVGLL